MEERRTIEDTSNFIHVLDKRVSRNTKIKHLSKKDPLITYSTLIEFGDVTAFKTYNKLCALMTGKISLEGANKKGLNAA